MNNAQLYSRAHSMQRRDAEDLIQEFSSLINWSDGKVLDIGCGTGEVTAEVLRTCLPKGYVGLLGVDVSGDMIQHARKTHQYPKLSFEQCDIADTKTDVLKKLGGRIEHRSNNKEIDNEHDLVNELKRVTTHDKEETAFDVVLSFYCLHWIHDQRLAIKNIQRLLKKNGEALLVFLVRSPIFDLYEEMSRTPSWSKYMKDVDQYLSPYRSVENPQKEFERLLETEGLTAIRTECRERNYDFNNITTMRAAIKAVNPFLPRIPTELREEYIDDCMEMTLKLRLSKVTQDGCHVTYTLLVAHIIKSK